MSEVEFKVGDKVYCPTLSNEIITIASNNTFWFKSSIGDKMWTSFTNTGKLKAIYNNQSIFPATHEWYEKLSHVYPNLEKPLTMKSSKEIIQKLLDDGNAGVLCWVSDVVEMPMPNQRSSTIALIVKIDKAFNNFVDFDGDVWNYATPITPIKSYNQTIIDYVDGEMIIK